MSVLEVSLIPSVCALCTRPFVRREAVQCPQCEAVVCRMSERPCLALHQTEEHT